MSFFRSVLPVSLISILTAAGLLFLGSLFGYEDLKSGYAVVKTGVSAGDKYVCSLLESSGDFKGEIVSESSQWVFLDTYDSLEMIPLDSYSSRVFEFDPRNDGYADKLKDIFIKDDSRFFYVPLRAGDSDSLILDKQLNELLSGIPFTVDYYGVGRPLLLFFIIFASASFCMLVICVLKGKKYPEIINVITLIPPLSSLAFFGASGIGCAAVLLALFIFLIDPVNELAISIGSAKGTSARYASKVKAKNLKTIYKNIILPYRFYWLFLPIFIAALACMVVFSQVNPLLLLMVFTVSSAVFYISIKLLALHGKEHRRFTPVMIIRSSFPKFIFPGYILPFAAGVLIALFFSPIVPGSYNSNEKFETIVSENDYHEHIAFQSAFSTSQIGSSSKLFPAFYFDTDGLPSMKAVTADQKINFNDYPPFPLKKLMDFFVSVNNGNKSNTGAGSAGIAEKISLLVLLLFLIPGLIIRKKDDNSRIINLDVFKRISGKMRPAGINRNKKLVYNNKNPMRKCKDA